MRELRTFCPPGPEPSLAALSRTHRSGGIPAGRNPSLAQVSRMSQSAIQHCCQTPTRRRKLAHQHRRPPPRVFGIELARRWVEAVGRHDPARLLSPGRRRRCRTDRCRPQVGLSCSHQRRRAARPVFDEPAIPHRMQVRAATKCLQLDLVTTTVVCIAGVQWLVDIADEVHDVL